MRKLYVIRVIHSEQDMGSLIGKIREEYVRRHGLGKWAEHLDAIRKKWVEIRRAVESLKLPYEKTRLYQDGLPECGKEREIVGDIASTGSPNHVLLLDLIGKGATLMGTENAGLLLEEYDIHKKGDSENRGEDILRRRDRHIASRINSTLMDGEIGLLFIGLAHNVAPFLDQDIRVENLSGLENG
jgi:hypothetical protein